MGETSTIDRGPWQQTFTGRKFYPLSPLAEDIDLRDIAHALSMQCRFGGHCKRFYSVGQHSLYVGTRVERLALRDIRDPALTNIDDVRVVARAMLAGCLHDGSEAYAVDVPRPIKFVLRDYRPIERGIMQAIAEHFELPADAFDDARVHRADEEMLITEARDLMGPPPEPWTFRAPVKPMLTSIPCTSSSSGPASSDVADAFERVVLALVASLNTPIVGRARQLLLEANAIAHKITGPMVWPDDASDLARHKGTSR